MHSPSDGRAMARPLRSAEPLDVLAEAPAKAAIGALLLSLAAVLVLMALLIGPR